MSVRALAQSRAGREAEEGSLAEAGMAAAYPGLGEKESRTGRAYRGVLGGEDMQSDHTHVIACKEEGKGQCWARRW